MTKMILSKRLRKHVVGQRITKVLLNQFHDGRNQYTYDPEIHLENGVVIFFTTDETESLEYGIRPNVWVPKGDS